MEKKLFLIEKYREYSSENHKPEEFNDGYITVKNANDQDSWDFESCGFIVQGINLIINEGWTIVRCILEGDNACVVYAEKQERHNKQQVVSLSSSKDSSWRYDLKSFNQLLAKGWRIQDTFSCTCHPFFLLEFNQDDVISSEQAYLDKIRDIITVKGRLRTSDLIELTALREKLGIL